MAILNNSNAISSGGYDINNSLRFRSSASAYLSRTPASAGNRKTWTWSGWVKRGGLGTINAIFECRNGTSDSTVFGIQFGEYATSNDYIAIVQYTQYLAKTNAVFRDPSAWYHVVAALDTTQATAANRFKLYVNGIEQTFSSTIYPSQNADLGINQAFRHDIGNSNSVYYNGYLTDINFIDGQALTPSSFGETDTTTGSWKPKAYTGTYGTNGFYLKFSDIATTSGSNAGLGKDFSGNANYWTTNNISVTAGTTYDAMIDSPTLTSATVANYPVINPLQTGSYVTASNGNLTLTGNTATNSAIATASFSFASGKYYYEYTQGTVASETCGFALAPVTGSLLDGEVFAGNNAFGARAAGTTYGTSKIASSLTSWASGDIVGIAIDADNGAAYWSKNGVWQTSGVPTSGASKTGAVAGWTPTASSIVTPFFGAYNGGFINVNFGQRPFAYTPPTGFNRVNTYNLPDSTIVKGNSYMDVALRTGTGTADGQSQVISSLAFTPDLVWNKARSNAFNHNLVDSVRGNDTILFSNLTNAETSVGTTGTQLQITTNGFTAIQRTSYQAVNQNGVTYADWCWKAGGTSSSNTSGSITSTVSVNATAGFSVVTYTGTGANATVGHGLGVAPKMIIVKNRSITQNWITGHTTLWTSNSNNLILLNTTGATINNSAIWNTSTPTPSVFSVGNDTGVSGNGNSLVAYCFAEISGYSKFNSYTGNGASDGPFVYLGFRPRFIMVKRTDTTGDWVIWDSSRNTYNVAGNVLYSNSSAAEATGAGMNFMSNGFKFYNDTGASVNASGGSYIYMAFAENPFKNSNAR